MGQRRSCVRETLELNTNCCINKICCYAGISKSSYYFSKKIKVARSTGRPPPGYTINRNGLVITDYEITLILKEYRSSTEFLNGGGAKKLSKYMAVEKSIYVNHKKVYRLCSEHNLLLFKQSDNVKRKIKKKRCEYLDITAPHQLWQFDIKYGYVHGEQKYFFLLSFIDVYSKKIVGYYIGKSCKSGDLVFTLNQALGNEGIKNSQQLIIRSDNGPQMSSNKFYFYLKRLEQKLAHEFIPPRTPNRNAYIESFFSIFEKEVLQVRYFKTFKEAYDATVNFITFYNNRRLHGSIGNRSPKMFLEAFNGGKINAYSLQV